MNSNTSKYIAKRLIWFGLLLAFPLTAINAQPFTCADASFGAGNGQQIQVSGAVGLSTFCAPVTANWFVSFSANIPAAASVEIIVDWGDGTSDIYSASESGNIWSISNGNGDNFTSGPQTYNGINVAKHIYPIDLATILGRDICFFDIDAQLVIDGNPCPASTIINIVNYWDTDEDAPGNVAIEPILYQICEGDEVTISFEDVTTFNCVNPGDTDNPNEDLRNVRWTYNTTDGIAPSGRIDGITLSNGILLDGNNGADQYYVPPQADVPGSDPNTIETYPAIVGPGDAVSTTLDLTVPSSATEGEVFEVQLENWGPCNPLGGSIDPIIRYAIIEIVAPPRGLDFTISSDVAGANLKTNFCPGEDIRFRGSTTNETADFEYSWAVYDGPNDTDPIVFSRNNIKNTWLSEGVADLNSAFSTAGTKLVRMYVRNSDTNLSGNCEVFIDKTLEIIATPQAVIGFNDGSFGAPNTADSEFNLCANDLPLSLELTDESSGKTANLTTRWEIQKIAPNASFIDGIDDGGAGAALFDYPSSPLNITDTGHYQIKLFIDDASTNCSTEDQLDIYIYDAPEASFTATGVCNGELTDFDPSNSLIPTIINSDEITDYYWDFSYDGITFNNEFQRDNTSPTFSRDLGSAGIYTVALRVESAKSCLSNLYVLDVEVYPNPESDLTAVFTNDSDTNSAGDLYNGNPICPSTELTFINTTDESLNDLSIIDVVYNLVVEINGVFDENIPLGRPDVATTSPNDTILFDRFTNNSGVNKTYTITLSATSDEGCEILSSSVDVIVLPGENSGFKIAEDEDFNDLYDAATDYCSPQKFHLELDNSLIAYAVDSIQWEIYRGDQNVVNLVLDSTTYIANTGYDSISYTFLNNYPTVTQQAFTIVVSPFVDGVCVNSSTRIIEVAPKPISDFIAIDTVFECNQVTYIFEALQAGLGASGYIWDAQPADSVLSSSIDDNEFTVSYKRPTAGGLATPVNVSLQTVSPFGCLSDVSDPFTDTFQAQDNFTIDLIASGTAICIPAIYNFDNQTVPADIPANTLWELHITNTDLGTTNIIKGVDISSSPDFSDGYDYEFTVAGNYEISLKALLESNCDLSSDPPIYLTINNKPQMDFRVSVEQGCSSLPIQFIDNSINPPNNDDLQSVTLTVENLTTGIDRAPIVISGSVAANFWNGKSIDSLRYDVTNTLSGIHYNDYVLAVEGVNNEGCSDISRDTVRVFRSPIVDFEILAPNPACEENYEFEFDITTYSVPSGTSLSWNWGDGTQTVNPSSANIKHEYLNRGSFFASDQYVVTLTAQTPNGCISSVSDTVKLHPRIQANFFQDKNIGCSPLNVNFTTQSLGVGLLNNHIYKKRVKGATTWTNFASTVNDIGSVSENFINTTAANITYEILYMVSSDVGGCSDTAAIKEITIYPEFNSPPITGSDKVCEFEQGVVYTVPLITGSTYLWSLPLGAFVSDKNAEGNEITVSFSNFSGEISVTEINENGCFGKPSVLAVNVLKGPTASLQLSGPNVICPGDSTSLKFNLTGPGDQGYDIVYNNGATNDTLYNIQNGHEIKVGPANSTNYFLLNVTDREYPACFPSSISGAVFISVNIKPTVTLTGNATICEDVPTNLFFNLTGIGPWKVTYTDGTSEYKFETSSPVHLESVSPTSSVTYTPIEVTDGNNPICNGEVNGSATITVNQKPRAEIYGDQNNICANSLTEIKLKLKGVAPWIVRYTDGNNIYTLNNITPPITYDPAIDEYVHTFEVSPASGTTSYQLIDIRDSNNPSCLGDISGSAVIEAYDRPIVSLEGNATICEGQSTPIQFNITGDGPFNVRYTANSDTLQLSNANNTETINVSPATSTVYRIVDVIDIRGCVSNLPSGPISVNVNPLPTAALSGADTICYGNQVNLIFDLTGVGPWQISYTDGVQSYNFTTSFNRHFEPITPTVTRTYSLLSITDSNNPNCINTGTGTPQIVVYPRLEASFTATPEEMVLPKSDVAIVNTTTNKGSWQYSWDFGDGTTSNAIDPGTHVYETYGQYIIKLTATNGLCTDTFEQLVTIGAIPPIVDFTATPLEGCIPLVVDFENLTKFADPSSYQWEFGDNQRVRAVENPTHVYTSPGVYTVRLVANNITGQEREVIKEAYITVYETPQASFTIPDEFRQVFTGEEVQFVNTSLRADQYIWKFGDGNQSFDENPVHVYPDSGIYDISLIAINSTTGCEDSFKLDAQVKVILGGDSKIANAFTPSRSGPGSASSNIQSNDVFLPQLKGVATFDMKIYNRWGELLFETKDKNIGWDGYYKGQLMPQGVYVYRLLLVYDNGRRETKVGDITLIR